MKELQRPPGMLRTLRFETRVALTTWVAMWLSGYLVMGIMAARRAGFTRESIETYYVGDEARMQFGKSTAELLELTHFHLFAMPLTLFVIGHLFLLSSWPRRLKVSLFLLCAAGMAVYMAAPWLIRDVSPRLAQLQNLGRLLAFAPLALFAVVVIVEMWRPMRDDPRTPLE